MIRILLSGRDLVSRLVFKSALDESDTQTTCVDSGRETLSAISENEFDLVIADENLGDMTGFELIESVISRQPMLNCALVSSLSPVEFHQAAEGLGILKQLSIDPGQKEVQQLLEQLKKIQSFPKISGPRKT